jgi:hypothetical protein
VTAAGSSCDRGGRRCTYRSWQRCRGRGGRRARPLAAAAACTGEATRKPSAKQAWRRARSHVPMASASCVAPRRARSLRSRAGAGADIARARPRARARAACATASRAYRAQRQGRPKLRHMFLRMRDSRPGWGAPVDGGLNGGLVSQGSEEVGDEVDRRLDRLARILVPRRVHCDVCGWRVSCVRSGVCVGTVVLFSRGGGRRGRDFRRDSGRTLVGLGRRSHLDLQRKLRLDQKGVDLLCVERRRRCDDKW